MASEGNYCGLVRGFACKLISLVSILLVYNISSWAAVIVMAVAVSPLVS